MKEKFIENGIEYVKHGDYYFPNLYVPNNKEYMRVGEHHQTYCICFNFSDVYVTQFFFLQGRVVFWSWVY